MIKSRPAEKETVRGMDYIKEKYIYYYKDLKGLLDGRLAYLRTAGSVIIEPLPINSILILVSGLWVLLSMIRFRDDVRKFIVLFALTTSIVFPCFFILFGYTYADRYFSYFFPLGMLLGGIFLSDVQKKYRRAAGILFVLVLSANIFYVGVDFFYNYRITEGRLSSFDIGFIEGSHFPAVTTKIMDVLAGEKEAYYFEKGNPCDLNSIFKFYTYGKMDYHTLYDLKEDFRDDAFYFSVDLDEKNDSLREFYNNRKENMYVKDTLVYTNMLNETKMRVYILGQKKEVAEDGNINVELVKQNA
jgi:hypothetical protein